MVCFIWFKAILVSHLNVIGPPIESARGNLKSQAHWDGEASCGHGEAQLHHTTRIIVSWNTNARSTRTSHLFECRSQREKEREKEGEKEKEKEKERERKKERESKKDKFRTQMGAFLSS